MRYFLIDYENIHSLGLRGLSKVSKTDKVIIFHSESDKVAFDTLELIGSCPASVSYIMNGLQAENSLDFQMVFYMGRLVGKFKGKELQLIIISNDKGYDAVMCCKGYIPMEHVEIQRFPSIEDYFSYLTGETPKVENVKEKESVSLESLRKQIKDKLKSLNCTEEEINTVLKEVRVCYWDPQYVHNHLQKVYGRRGSKLYGYVKLEIRAYLKLKMRGCGVS